MLDTNSEACQKVGEAWNSAEKAIKIAEQVNREVISPAVFELRYAGRKLIEANECAASDSAKSEHLLQDAYMDCLRARHDAIDAATSKIIADLDIAVSTLGAKTVLACFPQWSSMFEQVCKVRERISVSRGKRDDREAIYETIEAVDLPALVGLYNRFKASEPMLIAGAKKDRLHLLFSYAIGVLGLLIGVSCFFVG